MPQKISDHSKKNSGRSGNGRAAPMKAIAMIGLGVAIGLLLSLKLSEDKKQLEVIEVKQSSLQSDSTNIGSHHVAQKVTAHLQEIDNQRTVRRLEALDYLHQIRDLRVKNQGISPQMAPAMGVHSLRESDREQRIFQDLNRQGLSRHQLKNATDRINQMVAKDQLETDVFELADEAYVDQFLANARAAGYDVVLDDSLEVVAIRPLKPLSVPQLSGRAGQ